MKSKKELKKITEGFRKLYTGAVSDVMDKMGVRGYMDAEIKPILPNKVMCGTAVTVKAEQASDPLHQYTCLRPLTTRRGVK